MAEIKDKKATLFHRVFTSKDGTEVLRQLMRDTHMFDTTFEAGDPYTSAYYEGQRSVVTGIMRRIKAHTKNPAFFQEAMKDDFDPTGQGGI